MRRAIDFLLLATTILVVLCVLGQGECSKKESDQSNSSNSTSKNFYFRPQQAATGKRLQQQAKKSSAHLIKNRNAVATSKHLKSKQGNNNDNIKKKSCIKIHFFIAVSIKLNSIPFLH